MVVFCGAKIRRLFDLVYFIRLIFLIFIILIIFSFGLFLAFALFVVVFLFRLLLVVVLILHRLGGLVVDVNLSKGVFFLALIVLICIPFFIFKTSGSVHVSFSLYRVANAEHFLLLFFPCIRRSLGLTVLGVTGSLMRRV